MLGKNEKIWFIFGKKREDFGNIWKNLFFSEKGRLEGTGENFEKNKVQREKWPVPSNGPPVSLHLRHTKKVDM